MKILLVQPPFLKRKVISLEGTEIPLNLIYLASALEQPKEIIKAYNREILPLVYDFINFEKNDIQILDLQLYTQPLSIFEEKIKKFKPDLIGFTAFTIQATYVKKLSKIAKKIKKDTYLIFGGVHASALPEKSLEEIKELDIIVIGEGEITLLEICTMLWSKNKRLNGKEKEIIKEKRIINIKDIKGICYRIQDIENSRKSKFFRTKKRPLIQNLDLIPFPNRGLLNQSKYRPYFVNYMSLPTTGILGTRGCPFHCAYCSKAVYHRVFRIRSPENVVKEMEFCEQKYGIKDFRFFDDAVTTNNKWIKEFCLLLIKKKKNYTWNGFSRVDRINEPLLKLMIKAGCYHLKLGVESGTDYMLKKINKEITRKQAIKASQILNKSHIEYLMSYIINFPNETLSSMYNTLEFAKKLNSTYAMFFFLKPLPGSKIFIDAMNQNSIITYDWSRYTEEDPPILRTQKTGKEIDNLLHKFYFWYYFRPKYFFKMIKDIVEVHSLKRIIRTIKGFFVLILGH